MMNILRGKMRIMRIISYNIFYHYILRTRFHLIEEGGEGGNVVNGMNGKQLS